MEVLDLQFEDDTIMVFKPSASNLWGVKNIIRCSELVFDMKINYHKSSLIGILVDDNLVMSAASFLFYKIGKILFLYLGILVGAYPRNFSTWRNVIDSVARRLAPWKRKHISFGRRETDRLWWPIVECGLMIYGIGILTEGGRPDRWRWGLHTSGVYTVSSAYLAQMDSDLLVSGGGTLAQPRQLSLKRGSYSLDRSKMSLFSPRRDISHSGETTLAQARILQYSPGFHPPIIVIFNLDGRLFIVFGLAPLVIS
ncbi:hypothetical protein Lal_00004131 [Lupinus albus]|nr:hypothetical protein Lal_00004131 [Lupinus albus]